MVCLRILVRSDRNNSPSHWSVKEETTRGICPRMYVPCLLDGLSIQTTDVCCPQEHTHPLTGATASSHSGNFHMSQHLPPERAELFIDPRLLLRSASSAYMEPLGFGDPHEALRKRYRPSDPQIKDPEPHSYNSLALFQPEIARRIARTVYGIDWLHWQGERQARDRLM